MKSERQLKKEILRLLTFLKNHHEEIALLTKQVVALSDELEEMLIEQINNLEHENNLLRKDIKTHKTGMFQHSPCVDFFFDGTTRKNKSYFRTYYNI